MPELSLEDEQLVVDYISRMLAFMDGRSKDCIHCLKPVEFAVKRSRSVYAYPCGCRQCQGSVPVWAKQSHRCRC